MSAPRVLIVSSQSLFAESLRILLEREGCQVIGVRPYDDGVPNLIETLQPTVVVLDMQNIAPTVTATLLDCAPNIRILQVSLQGGQIAVYDHQQQRVPSVRQFLDLVTLKDRRPVEEDLPLPGAGQAPD